jgi:hypothetical protein
MRTHFTTLVCLEAILPIRGKPRLTKLCGVLCLGKHFYHNIWRLDALGLHGRGNLRWVKLARLGKGMVTGWCRFRINVHTFWR